MDPMLVGFFEEADQVPVYDPGILVPCLICGQRLSAPIKTINLMPEDGLRSYFYRVHKDCFENLTCQQAMDLDSSIIDQVVGR